MKILLLRGFLTVSILLPVTLPAAPFDLTATLGEAANFTVLGLENGEVIINSATSITGDVGYSNGVVSNTNQKVDLFNGSALIHSGATVSITGGTYSPSGGIQTGAAVDAKLNQANIDAINASTFLGNLQAIDLDLGVSFAEFNLGSLADNDSRTIDSTGGTGSDIDAGNVDITRLNLDSLSYKSDSLTLIGDSTDVFLFNVSGDFNFASSEIILSGITFKNVIFNFLTAADINIYKAENKFNGRILAVNGVVDYHNPATFNGAIIASSINLHSDFNISGPGSVPEVEIPEPQTLILMLIGLTGIGFNLRKLLKHKLMAEKQQRLGGNYTL